MTNNTKKSIIDVKPGNITGKYSKDKAILVGLYPFKDSPYTDNIELVLNLEDGAPISIVFPYSGYNMQLFVGDFTGDNKSEIMVRGSFGGSGGFEIAVIYRYEDNKLIEIFNQDQVNQYNPCTAKYQDNYNVHVNCDNKKYSIDISSRPKEYLEQIYTPTGTVKPYYEPYIDSPNAIYPIKQVYNDAYQLLIQQRIVGIANADTLGVIQTLASLINSEFEIIYKGLLLPQYNFNSRKVSKKLKTKLTNSNINKPIQK